MGGEIGSIKVEYVDKQRIVVQRDLELFWWLRTGVNGTTQNRENGPGWNSTQCTRKGTTNDE